MIFRHMIHGKVSLFYFVVASDYVNKHYYPDWVSGSVFGRTLWGVTYTLQSGDATDSFQENPHKSKLTGIGGINS